MNLLNSEDRTRLFKAIQLSDKKLDPFRKANQSLVEDYAGSSYGQDSPRPKLETLVNLIQQAVDAYTMALVANRPRVMIDTNREDRKFFAKHFTVAVNNMIQDMNLELVLKRWVMDAFFMLGIVKVHLAETEMVELWAGVQVDPGVPTASNVSLDDFVFDMSAKRWEQIRYAADTYRIPFAKLESGPFDETVVKDVRPSSKLAASGDSDRTELLSRGYAVDDDDVEPMVDLIDVWIPAERKIYTFAADSVGRFTGNLPPLADMPWEADMGPYQKLSFSDVPDNIMPSSPVAQFVALSRLANSLLRKQARQAKRQKDVGTYTPAGAEDAKKVQRSSDGDWVQVQDTKEIGMMKMGGVDASNQAFSLHVIDLLDRMADNLPARLGLGSQADTLGQEQLIVGSASKKEAQMRYQCLSAARDLIRTLSWMLWHDAAQVIPGRMLVPGVDGASIDATWAPDYRQGEFFDYDIDIDVYSMAYQPPSEKVKALNGLLTQIYIPMGQLLGQQGGQINMQALTEMYAELLHLPRLPDIVQFVTPPAAESASAGGGGATPPETTRNYVRRSVATGGTPASKSIQEQQAWLSRAGEQGAEPMMQGSMA